MAKKIKTVFKLNLQAGAANPAPPVGPILGQQGVNIMEFCKAYNDATKDKRGQVIPAEITVYEDRSFTFILKLPPVSALIKQAAKIQSGAKTTGKETVATITTDQVREIAQTKMPDLNCTSIDSAMQMVMGTARSMGVKVA
ncbi:50S ribosomal protein L11 [Candidatus Cerribacteria bacterium 'Amazon FNV 2010 28 9']|uniref:Large ribosomal subunit protein uL11 n=1 Tax=Candidatus Cerribacteria bacterium 'Amazon FNV 2010 28 9' TaxID=2081795 RepID=A0A317JUZ4_9BACT|nr:MAG: 50S ribosomal protein L11 [Candidatus Cerribacteria bacterium 'Amazon FNV 2010 28 9']